MEHMADLCLHYSEASKFFSGVVALACIPISSVPGFLFPPSSLTPVGGGVLMMAVLTGVWWNLHVVLICIFFMARDGEHFSCVFWPFEFFF
jgi:hypothetical protein